MLYEDTEKQKASSLILSLCLKPSNLKPLSENEVLIGALTRVFREDGRKNFDLGTNLASVFFQFSLFSKFHGMLSHYKIGALSLQLVESELKRYEMWHDQYVHAAGDQKRKWELAMRKQEVFLVECLKILANLATETKTEVKMVKRGLLQSLFKCLEHTKSALLLKTSILFLWKLSVYAENKDAMDKLGVVERVVELLPNSDSELANLIFSLMFNLAFDQALRAKMVSSGLTNHVAGHISTSEVALGLLYQLSIVDDAKAIFTFTDSIPTLIQLLKDRPDSLTVKGTLVNVAVEKRNAQLICGADGKGLNELMEMAFKKEDPMLFKLIRNLGTHEGPIQQLFVVS
ncbi:hypothetical protein M3Y97_01149500 [Aphelenchoides bicaudatus]|nr:hypothetical protein M3Y97_01149500 [Aphelenchoides bicaudatus]